MDGVRSDALEHIVQIGMRIDVVQSARADQAVETRCGLAGSVRSGKEIITPAEHCLSLTWKIREF